MLVDHPHEWRITPDEALNRLHEAVKAARAYFRIPEEIEILITPNTPGELNSPAAIQINAEYLRAVISVQLQAYMTTPGAIWGDMGHEVAHLMTREYDLAFEKLPFAKQSAARKLYRIAEENATVRLERMFVRDCPDPHAASQSGEL